MLTKLNQVLRPGDNSTYLFSSLFHRTYDGRSRRRHMLFKSMDETIRAKCQVSIKCIHIVHTVTLSIIKIIILFQMQKLQDKLNISLYR